MTDWWRRWGLQGRPGAGVVLALTLLLGVETALHSDAFMHRLRSVFAVGRAFDKVLYVEQHPPKLLILGNSRMDNGIDPVTLAAPMGPDMTAFNLGLPGANATTLKGIVGRLDGDQHLGPGRIERVIIGLDEGLLQEGDSLGYGVFFADQTMEGGLSEFVRTHLHLWGYEGNLKQLREPAKLIQFVQALLVPTEPIGGGAVERHGYRPGFGGTQDADQVQRQEVGSTVPPGKDVVADFFSMVELLQQRGVDVAIVFPPLLSRSVLYLDASHPAAGPYRTIVGGLAARRIPMYALGAQVKMAPSEFVNAGHLNDKGAQRFSAMLGETLAQGIEARFMRVVAP